MLDNPRLRRSQTMMRLFIGLLIAQLPLWWMLLQGSTPNTLIWIGQILWTLLLTGALLRLEMPAPAPTPQSGTTPDTPRPESVTVEQIKARYQDVENRFLTIFQRSPIAISISDLHDDHVVEINPAGLKLLGYTLEDYRTRKEIVFGNQVAPPQREKMMTELNEYGFAHHIEMQTRTKTGEVITTLNFVEKVMLDGTPQKITFTMDISELRRTQERLTQSRQDLQVIVTALPDFYFRLDSAYILTDHMSGDIPALGLPPEQFIGKSVDKVLPANVAESYKQAIRTAFDSPLQSVTTIEYTLTINRRLTYFEVRIVRESEHSLLAIARDITKRKKQEEKLRESEALFRHLTENINEVLFIRDLKQGKNVYMSPLYFNVWEESENDASYATSSFLSDVHDEDLPNVKALVQQQKQGKEAELEYRIVHPKTGETRWLRSRSVAIRDDGGEVYRMAMLSENITARKLDEEALRQREAEFRALTENSPDLIVRLDRDLRHLFVNQTLLKASNTTKDTYLGKTMRETLELMGVVGLATNFESVYARWVEAINTAFETGEEVHVDYHYDFVDADNQYLETRYVPEFDQAGKVKTVLCITRDNTEQVRAEIERREQERMLYEFAENLNEILVIRDSDTNLPIYISPGFEKIFGVPAHPLLEDYNAYNDMVLDDGVKKINQRRAKQPMALTEITYQICRRDGEFRWLRSRTFPIYNNANEVHLIGGLVEDFTERKLMENALRENQEIFDQLAHTINEVLFITDVASTQLIFISSQCELIWGYTAQQIMADRELLVNCIHPDDRERAYTAYHERRAGQENEIDYRIITATGQLRWLRSKAFPIRDEQGTVYRVAGMVEDITERLQIEAQMREHERLTLELKKQREINLLIQRFVAMVSHEFRTPLSVILSSSKMLETYAERMDKSQREAHLHKIARQTHHMTTLMDDVLTFQRLENASFAFNPEAFDLVAYCQELIAEAETNADNPRIELTVDGISEQVTMDKALIRHILLNLLSNAQKYSPPETKVTVTLKHQGDMVQLAVSDMGIGMPSHYLRKIFEPFHRADNVGTRRGNGLGLSIVKMSVDVHHGHIVIHSVEGEGTTVTVTLPTPTPP